ncbi:MAG: ATP synthase subunit I [Betaproteobacteria bacterium]|nr:ATP synthase subunit I [Betaproteobacteria bacterium]
MSLITSQPLRKVLRWQVLVTVVCAAGFGAWQGVLGAASAILGGAIPVLAGAAYGIIISRAKAGPASSALRLMLRAEAVKIALILLMLWLVLTAFREVSIGGFFVTFAVSVLAFSMAIAVREPQGSNT